MACTFHRQPRTVITLVAHHNFTRLHCMQCTCLRCSLYRTLNFHWDERTDGNVLVGVLQYRCPGIAIASTPRTLRNNGGWQTSGKSSVTTPPLSCLLRSAPSNTLYRPLHQTHPHCTILRKVGGDVPSAGCLGLHLVSPEFVPLQHHGIKLTVCFRTPGSI